MKIEVKVNDYVLKAIDVQAEQVNKIIEGFFAVQGVTSSLTVGDLKVETSAPKTVAPKAKEVPKQNPSTVEAVTPSKPKVDKVQVTKVLPKVNAERTLTTSIAEHLKGVFEAPGDAVQGDKKESFPSTKLHEDGTTLYQSHYWCPCGHKGKRWARANVKYLVCHECNEKLLAEEATMEFDADDVPLPDKFGNHFIARELY